jgi:hypothetical protein
MFPHYYIITGPPQREELLRENLIIIFRGVFTNFIKQNYTEKEERVREKRKMFPHYIIGPPQREEIFFLEKF